MLEVKKPRQRAQPRHALPTVAFNAHPPYSATLSSLSHVWLFVTPWTAACQAPLSMGFPRQEYCSGLPFPALRDLPDPGVKSRSGFSSIITISPSLRIQPQYESLISPSLLTVLYTPVNMTVTFRRKVHLPPSLPINTFPLWPFNSKLSLS